MTERRYDAILLDADGTLVDDSGAIRPRVLDGLRAIHERGVRVMVATGRSEAATRELLEELGFDTPAVVFNGAGVYCPVERRLTEERILAEETVESTLSFCREVDALPVVIRAGQKFAVRARDEHEATALRYFHDMREVVWDDLPREYVIRVTLFTTRYDDSYALAGGLETAIERPVYLTHFPLNALADHRESPLLVADVHPPCRGKAEGVRLLEELYDIPAERVVAVGDATNDLPMFAAAGLGVAMENAMDEALQAADRVIGNNNTDALRDLVDELF